MKKVVYKHQMYYAFLIIILGVLLVWNLLNFSVGNYLSIISIAIQAVLLLLVIIRHEKTKVAIRIWTAIILIGALLKIGTILFSIMVLDDEFGPAVESIIVNLVKILLAYIVYSFNENSVKVEIVESHEHQGDE